MIIEESVATATDAAAVETQLAPAGAPPGRQQARPPLPGHYPLDSLLAVEDMLCMRLEALRGILRLLSSAARDEEAPHTEGSVMSVCHLAEDLIDDCKRTVDAIRPLCERGGVS